MKPSRSPKLRSVRGVTAVSIGAVIKVCRESWKAHRKLIPRNQVTEAPAGGWVVPAGLDLAVWARYQKDAPDEDIMAVLFSLVLGVSDDDLAEGFQTSTGTIRYRLGKGVRQLGLVARGSGSSPAARSAGR